MGSAPAGGGDADRFTGPVAGELPPGLATAFGAGGEMGAQLGSLDWSATRLGPPRQWPSSLVTAMNMMLASRASWAELGGEAARVLAGYRADVPLGLVFLGDGSPGGEVLVGCGGVEPAAVRPVGGGDPRGLPSALADVLAGGPAGFGKATDFVTAPPEDAADEVLVLPITAGTEPAGALVVGISRRLSWTDEYRTFFDLVAAALSSAVAIHRAYELERARVTELATLNQAKTNFFTNVSHEFRTPLTLVQVASPPDDTGETRLYVGEAAYGTSPEQAEPAGSQPAADPVGTPGRPRLPGAVGPTRPARTERLRALADAAVAVNTARSTSDVLRVAARHAQTLAGPAGWWPACPAGGTRRTAARAADGRPDGRGAAGRHHRRAVRRVAGLAPERR